MRPPVERRLVGAWPHQHAASIAELDEIRSLVEPHALREMTPEHVEDAVPLARRLIDRSREVSLAFYSLPDAARQSLEQHESILDALAAGDVDEAADRMLAHLNSGGKVAGEQRALEEGARTERTFGPRARQAAIASCVW